MNPELELLYGVANAWMQKSGEWITRAYQGAGLGRRNVPGTVGDRIMKLDQIFGAYRETIAAQQKLIDMQARTIADMTEMIWQATRGKREDAKDDDKKLEMDILAKTDHEDEFYLRALHHHSGPNQILPWMSNIATHLSMITYARAMGLLLSRQPPADEDDDREDEQKTFRDKGLAAAEDLFRKHFVNGNDSWEPPIFDGDDDDDDIDIDARLADVFEKTFEFEDPVSLPGPGEMAGYRTGPPASAAGGIVVAARNVFRDRIQTLASVYTSYLGGMITAHRPVAAGGGGVGDDDSWFSSVVKSMRAVSSNAAMLGKTPFQVNVHFANSVRIVPMLRDLTQWVFVATSMSADSKKGIEPLVENYKTQVKPYLEKLVTMVKVHSSLNGAVTNEITVALTNLVASIETNLGLISGKYEEIFNKRKNVYKEIAHRINNRLVGDMALLPDFISEAMVIRDPNPLRGGGGADDDMKEPEIVVDLADKDAAIQFLKSNTAYRHSVMDLVREKSKALSLKVISDVGITVQTVSGFIMADVLRGLLVLLELLAHPEENRAPGTRPEPGGSSITVMWPEDIQGEGGSWKPRGSVADGYQVVFRDVDRVLARQFTAYADLLDVFSDVEINDKNMGAPFRSYIALAHRVRSIADDALSRGILRKMNRIEDAAMREDNKKKLPRLVAESHARLIADAVGGVMSSVWERVAFQQRQYIERNMADSRGSEFLRDELLVLAKHIGAVVPGGSKPVLRDIIREVNKTLGGLIQSSSSLTTAVSKETGLFLDAIIREDGVSDPLLVGPGMVAKEFSGSMADLRAFIRLCRLVSGSSSGTSMGILRDLPFADVIGVKTVPIEVMRAAIARVKLDTSIQFTAAPLPSSPPPPSSLSLPYPSPPRLLRASARINAELPDPDMQRQIVNVDVRVSPHVINRKTRQDIYVLLTGCHTQIGMIEKLAGGGQGLENDPMKFFDFRGDMVMAYQSVVRTVQVMDQVFREGEPESKGLVCVVTHGSWWTYNDRHGFDTFQADRAYNGKTESFMDVLGMCASILGHVYNKVRTALTWCAMRLQIADLDSGVLLPGQLEDISLAGYGEISTRSDETKADGVLKLDPTSTATSVEDVHRMLVGMIRVVRDFENTYELLLTDLGVTAVANALAYMRSYPNWSKLTLTACVRADDSFRPRFAWMISAFARRASLYSTVSKQAPRQNNSNVNHTKELAAMAENEYTLLGGVIHREYKYDPLTNRILHNNS